MNPSTQKSVVGPAPKRTSRKAAGVGFIATGSILCLAIVIPYVGIVAAIIGIAFVFCGFGLIAFKGKDNPPE